MLLESNFEKTIQDFRYSCEEINISIMPKLHIIFYYVMDFIKAKEEPLGLYSKQAAEAIRYDFGHLWSQRCKVAQNHLDYSKKLFRAVIEYNSKYI